jgi:hypothetical protein
MKRITRIILLVAAVAIGALPAAAQSANRSTAPAGTPASPVGTFVQTADESRCRHHCASLTASAPHTMTTHQSLSEQQARSERCSKKMIRTR